MGNIQQKHNNSEEQEHWEAEEEELDYTCEICMESSLPVDTKFKNIYSGRTNKEKKQNKECTSKHHLCNDCIARYVEAKINDGGTPVIKCPGINCNVGLDVNSCRSFIDVSSKVFVRWCELLCESESLTNFAHHSKRAHCPGFSELILNECPNDNGIIETMCPSCKIFFCFNCVIPLKDQQAHVCSRQRSKDVKLIDRNDLLFVESFARQGWTRCPFCARYVERASGCPTITCRCGNKFCYRCCCGEAAGRRCNCFTNVIQPYEVQPYVLQPEEDPYLDMLSMLSVFTGIIFVVNVVLGKN
ncbi:probable E3 ubiquitin-protein ligase RNF217 [Papaver somniferum]|uniref:probable E3 ubiquitin-protein ligase RNF217 n=1 Tax=Papaver somniferum TaxID=3469 RepID=UPI000E6F9354|nr:probable E3 ubiquitin-protein ligase RNF217 [Papaver somniferum]